MVNFRDLGGLPAGTCEIRTGLLFRSDSLAYASPADARRLLEEFGIATVIDLRGEREVAERGRSGLGADGVAYVPVPITDVSAGNGDVAHHYVAILAERGPAVAGLVRRLAAPGSLPAVFHCEAGCDRTGVVAAVVLSLLGTPDEVICADYALTGPALPAINDRLLAWFASRGVPPPPGFPDPTWLPEARHMAATLDRVRRRWGSVEDWARDAGLTDDDLTRLREHLVAPRGR